MKATIISLKEDIDKMYFSYQLFENIFRGIAKRKARRNET